MIRATPPTTASNDSPHRSAPGGMERRHYAKEVSPELSTVSDWRVGRGGIGSPAVGIGISLPLRGSVEDQAPRRIFGRAVSDAGERPDLAVVLCDGARHRRPPAVAS